VYVYVFHYHRYLLRNLDPMAPSMAMSMSTTVVVVVGGDGGDGGGEGSWEGI
jgi:hypothetical protein